MDNDEVDNDEVDTDEVDHDEMDNIWIVIDVMVNKSNEVTESME